MRLSTHYAFSYFVVTCAGAGPEVAFPASLVSFIPDIDDPYGFLGKLFPRLSSRVMSKWGHRGGTHSFIALGIVILAASPSLFVSGYLYAGLVLAYASHIFIDIFNPYGVKLLAPYSKTKFRSFRSDGMQVEVSTWKEYVLVFLIVILSAVVTDRSFSMSGVVRSAAKLFYRNYATAIEDYRKNPGVVCMAKISYFNNDSRSGITAENPVLNIFNDNIILMDRSLDDPRLSIKKDDIVEIEIIPTRTPLKIKSISGHDPALLRAIPPGSFVSGKIIIHNFDPGIKSSEHLSVAHGFDSIIISCSSALPSELGKLGDLHWSVNGELERLKKSLPENRKAALEERNRALRKKINRLNSKGFYENYGDIVRLEDEAKSIQSRIDALNLNLDIGHEDTRQKIENIERGFSVDIEVVCLEI